MARGRRKNSDDTAMGCIAYVIGALLFAPIVGLFMVCSKDPDKKSAGWLLLIGGSILWLILAIL